ncbi:hypothetical protein LWM68_25430 [Niabella sp. W65]|nr:hypothetical protein [Niabella sp. W65]MCH7365811.1 hypothetical protein [Niabella sp. W65]
MVKKLLDCLYLHPNVLANMMDNRIKQIEAAVMDFAGASIINPFMLCESIICGRISMRVEQVVLDFDVKIYPQYPFQAHDSETIRFINEDLLEYGHVNEDGSICVHTLHHPKLTEKLALDLNGLKHWIIKYYIKQEVDGAYEHILVSDTAVSGRKSVFLFTDVDYEFKNKMYGKFTFSILNQGHWRDVNYTTLLVRKFLINKEKVACTWSSTYCSGEEIEGLFYFSDAPPVEHKRFAVKNFHQLESYFSQPFLRYLDTFSKQFKGTCYMDHFPLLVGYPVGKAEVHWQVMLIPFDELPNYGQKITGTNTWVSMLRKQPIIWGRPAIRLISIFLAGEPFILLL